MLYFSFIAICVCLAACIETQTIMYQSISIGFKKNSISLLLFLLLYILLIFFAGLRTRYNDTVTYMNTFRYFNISTFKITSFLGYGGFEIYQFLIKKYISDNVQVFIFISAIITTSLYVFFIIKHSKTFKASMFIYLTGSYVFAMAGMKQAFAMGISLYVIEAYLDNKKIKAVILLILAMSFHPYIICLLIIPFLTKRVWDKNTVVIIIAFICCSILIEPLLNIISFIGKEYSMSELTSHTINPIRVFVESIPVVLSLVFRDRINKNCNNPYLILGLNMMIVSFLFVSLSLFFSPIYFARIGNYFDVLSPIVIPILLHNVFARGRDGWIARSCYYLFYFAYFAVDWLTHEGTLFTDNFRHVGLLSLF